ncbi:hypothetical protein [Zobellia nedashkovskayae]|uniref:hypothetical protein n=1 Tax=Zobellia nedashkovskayae TaxID=2779510 RepID=UPI00188A8AAC|nr:hypothetical protein [Zobellia nedashkovskayae]
MTKNYSVLLFAMMLFSFSGMAQTDIPQKKELKIETANKIDDNAEPDQGTSLNIPSIVEDQPQLDFDIAKRNPVKMIDDRELVQAGAGMKIDPKVGPRQPEEGSKQHFADMYLGDVKNNGKFVGIMCRDHENVDGDRVKIYVNGDVVDTNILLTSSFKGVNVDLKKGFNRIDFEALNVGAYAPNTAQVNVYDDKGEIIYATKWLLSEGSKATLIITKEED